jgi:hypothetical protein
MTASLVVAPRFCGPPGSANGGYACGLIAAYLDGQAEITLRRPPPLATPWRSSVTARAPSASSTATC